MFSKDIDFLLGEAKDIVLSDISKTTPLSVFDVATLSFVARISEILFKDSRTKVYPDVVTFAYYCRKSNLNNIKEQYSVGHLENRIGRGILFHITPGNVPVNFAYSLVAGLLTGNINIVKISSKQFIQSEIIIDAIKVALKENYYFDFFFNRIFIVRYDRKTSYTDIFSKICDVRIIWGGDETIFEVRKSYINAKSVDLTFSNRYSIAVIDSERYLNSSDKVQVAHGFYNDTFLFDQNACTSPKTIFWIGDNINTNKAKFEFWQNIADVIEIRDYQIADIAAVDKLVAFYSSVILGVRVESLSRINNKLWHVTLNQGFQEIHNIEGNSGYFNEVHISCLSELGSYVNRSFQTVGYYGLEKNQISEWLKHHPLNGIDRIVPIGKTMDFDMVWDGYDLIMSLTRKISIV
jgi:hypothetical protein